ncbi:hypothetical protein [Nocardia transvalensis]|uniref:hypothetical protein n=1 Tax=Nocardia transvalensis TaxID=37333 RepID=UPI001894EFC3|nr:hypothetical protein [Nocardia transvalensis]MBF6333675.1 hypothetical protein [Nocardia transvalensis]
MRRLPIRTPNQLAAVAMATVVVAGGFLTLGVIGHAVGRAAGPAAGRAAVIATVVAAVTMVVGLAVRSVVERARQRANFLAQFTPRVAWAVHGAVLAGLHDQVQPFLYAGLPPSLRFDRQVYRTAGGGALLRVQLTKGLQVHHLVAAGPWLEEYWGLPVTVHRDEDTRRAVILELHP